MAANTGSRDSDFPVYISAPPVPSRRQALSRGGSMQQQPDRPPIPPRQSSLISTHSIAVPKHKFSGQSDVLISLSPEANSFLPQNSKNNDSSGVFTDLHGIDFTRTLSDSCKRYSSSMEDLSSRSKENVYPDISHAFIDVTPNRAQPFLPYSAEPRPPVANPFENRNIQDYGWNPGIFGPNTSSVPPPIGFNLDIVPPPAPGGPNFEFPQTHINLSSDPNTQTVGHLPRPASWSEVLDTGINVNAAYDLPNGNNVFHSYGPGGDPPTNGGDLMSFHHEPVVEQEYFTLTYFDPLYTRGRQESISCPSRKDSVSYSFGDAFPQAFNRDSDNSEGTFNFSTDWLIKENGSRTEVKQHLYPVLGDEFVPAEEQAPALPGKQRSWKSLSKASTPEKLRKRIFIDEESNAFCQMVAELKTQYKSTDSKTNIGIIMSPVCENCLEPMSIKVVIYVIFSPEPVHFTCDSNSLVNHVISQVLCNESLGHTELCTTDSFVLKVYDRSEYLLSDLPLSSFEYTHQCLKMGKDIKFEMLHKQEVAHPFLRTIDDDIQMLVFPKEYVSTDKEAVSRESLDILMETFYSEIERLSDLVLQGKVDSIQSKSLHQAVKAICAILAKIETIDISKAMEKLERVIVDMKNPGNRASHMLSDTDRDTMDAINAAIRCSFVEELQEVIDQLVIAVKQLVRMYCETFHMDFAFESSQAEYKESQEVTQIKDNFIVHVGSCHRLPGPWLNHYEEYKVLCCLYHGSQKLAMEVSTTCKIATTSGLCERVVWDQWIQFRSKELCILPRETRLCLTLCGLRNPHPGTTVDSDHKISMVLGGATIQLYNQKGNLVHGSQLVPLNMGSKADPLMPCCQTLLPDSVLLQVNLPDFDKNIFFPEPIIKGSSPSKTFDLLIPELKERVQNVLEKDCKSTYGAEELEIVWSYRHYLHEYPMLLPRILQAAHSWDWASLSEIYALLRDWKPVEPMQAFEMLLPEFPDLRVREFAVKSLGQMKPDDLVEFLPQLIQALKFESYQNSSLARLLLEQSCRSIRFAHQFFWLLKGAAAQDATFKRRYELMFCALASVAGDALYQEFKKQEELISALNNTAVKVRSAKEKETTLRRELETIFQIFENWGKILLPYNPSLDVCGIDGKSCSYFTSNAFPLKLVFKNCNHKADPVYVMYKVGDDLRQDMLTLQMIRIMDRLWLKTGLDLGMITFACLATGPKKGIIELVTESETLRKIQVSYGVTGSFKDRTIKEWLQKHNPTELEYLKAVENFTRSCAGYCVATYVLGVCDRHNDNIMLKESGHMFHIDFSKFLGDAQMFGSFKRDRVPFVFTSDMAYVINDGGKRADHFQHFIDLCCQGFNVLRKHADLFYSLFFLMSRSGIPGVSEQAAQYVRGALLPGHSDSQAAAMFTRMIEDSLKSVFTQFNFFLHNLAQLKFSSHNEGALLSFVPKTYSKETDGKIVKVELLGYQKRYTPEKHYLYIVQVEREEQKVASYIFRQFSEFVEFRDKLSDMFSLVTWPNFSTRLVLGRSNIRSVAESRKQEIDYFLRELQSKQPEISECDLVYTFFHPLLRDEQDAAPNLNIIKFREPVLQPIANSSGIQGQIKLSVQYNKGGLHVMIMHCKELVDGTNLPSPYVKTYLLPDPEKHTKRKTKVVKNTNHPTYNEVIEYKISQQEINGRTLQVTVWDQVLGENNFLGALYLKLRDFDLSKPTTSWYKLGKIQMTTGSSMA
ncbi:phosphatidylinositol 4-phosphate 3-kinase C2 domain-containing subunit alpha-like [Gigantopelta aegis]|uniref:phosphatidylinositol 4-phosphate 3-kinase C2 domain-containing subunit alpha-like n=1 Tax=Gigantopelta aegis TaxID=1735272 RepID=UPI001B88B78E|nr:phosphatidylinositol 4-phosphate 3-kinase C2 domain-containing subunit alpha-like [Gigantopelta aegis]